MRLFIVKRWQKIAIGIGIVAFIGYANIKGGYIIAAFFGWYAYHFFKNYSKATDKKEKSSQKKLLILFSFITLMCLYFTISPSEPSINTTANIPISSVPTQSKEEKTKQSDFSEKLSRDAGLSPTAANALEPILNNMRFSKSFTLKHDEMLDGYKDNPKTKGYRGDDDHIRNVIVYVTDDKITAVRHNDYDMLVDGKAVLGKYDFVIENESDLLTFAREDVKRFLKYPDSAEFGWYSDWKAAKNPKEIIVQSWVESKNDFGNTLRQNFQLKYTPDGKKLTSVIIGNQRRL